MDPGENGPPLLNPNLREEKQRAARPLFLVRGQPGQMEDRRNGRFRHGLGSKEHDERERDDGEEISGNNED